MFTSLFEILLLVTAVSADTFAVSLSYGINRIEIPTPSLLVLSSVSSGTLALSLFAGNFLFGIIPPFWAHIAGFLVLFALGLIKLFDNTDTRQATASDRDQNLLISPKEAALLGIALSLDSLAAGFGVGFSPLCTLISIASSFFISIGSILAGKAAGAKIACHSSDRFGQFGGILLILLAFFKLF